MESGSAIAAATYVQKGGVGKTTSAAHIAVAASQEHELNVLLVDLAGTQNDLATHFGIAGEVTDLDAPISAVFGDQWDFIRENIPDVVDRMVFETGEGPDLIPADQGLSGADNNLANVPKEERYDIFEAFLRDELADRYDFVLLDLPGKEDNIAINGLYAVENVITPLRPGAFERTQLDNLDEDLDTLADAYPITPRLALVLPTMVDRRTKLAEEFIEEINDSYPDVVGPSIPSTANISTLQDAGKTLFGVDDDELYASGREAREAYREATTEFISRIQ